MTAPVGLTQLFPPGFGLEVSLAPALWKLVGLPFDRERYLQRTARIVDRYATMKKAYGAEGSERRRLEVNLMYAHPSAWMELERIDLLQMDSRQAHAEEEGRVLQEGAALPADRNDHNRAFILALADYEWLARQSRMFSRGVKRFGLVEAITRYPSVTQDPIDGVDQTLVEAILDIPRGQRFAALRRVVSVRHHCPDFESRLLPSAEKTMGTERTIIGSFGDLKEGQARRVEVGGQTIAVFKHRGELLAIQDTCPHRGGPLGKGEVDEHGCVRCPLHGWPFDLRTGKMRGNKNIDVDTFEAGVNDDGTMWVGPRRS